MNDSYKIDILRLILNSIDTKIDVVQALIIISREDV